MAESGALLFMIPGTEDKPKSRRGLVWLFPLAVTLTIAAVALFNILNIINERTEAKNEYEGLLFEYGPRVEESTSAADEEKGIDHAALAAINSNYAGWLKIPDTRISYPVVHGPDNERYLTTTFEGRYNPAGTLFVDVNCQAGFLSQHVIVYGHNMKNGTLFGGLMNYLDASYLAEHSIIEIALLDGSLRTYRIFAARVTNSNDAAYQMRFADESTFEAFAKALGAPNQSGHLLTLSTCTNSNDDSERLLIHAISE